MTYLTTPAAELGPYAWGFLAVQSVALLTAVYLTLVRHDPHPIRGVALRRLGYALLVLSGAGMVCGGLRLAGISPFTERYWFYLIALLEIGLAAYALFYALVSYPARMREQENKSNRGSNVRGRSSMLPVNQSSSSQAQAPGARREARRSRKRRS